MLTLDGLLLFGRGPWATPGAELLILPGVVALPVLVAALPFLGARRTRRGATTVVLTSLTLFIATGIGVVAGHRVRMLAFVLAAQRAEPLIEAITRFERDHARPPRALEELIPRYLARVPPGIPPVQLVPEDVVARDYPGNPWALRANVRVGFLSFDEFIYLPRQDYESLVAVRRVRGWAYLRD